MATARKRKERERMADAAEIVRDEELQRELEKSKRRREERMKTTKPHPSTRHVSSEILRATTQHVRTKA